MCNQMIFGASLVRRMMMMMMMMMVWTVLFTSLMSLSSGESLRGETRQSSSYSSTGTLYSSHRAMDGNRSTCAHTKKLLNSWWIIDLLGVYDISSITFSYSGHPHVDMTDGRIHVGNSRKNNGTANPLVKNISNENYMSLHSFDSGVSGRYITITVPGTRFLILCEVNITGTVKASPFVLVEKKKTWEEALFHCREEHTDLASILDQQDQTWAELEARKTNSTLVWLGLHYTCTLNFWFWVDDHTVDFDQWDGEPDEECSISGAMETRGEHHWFEKSDYDKFYFICATGATG